MSESDSTLSSSRKSNTVKSEWLADAADTFILLCSFLLTTASIILLVLIFHPPSPPLELQSILQRAFSAYAPPASPHIQSILQRAVSALSLTITSAMIIVAGKRYVHFKLAREGIRSRRVAVYSSPSIGSLVHHLACNGFEPLTLALSVIWVLGLVTGLSVNDAWAMVPEAGWTDLGVFSGPLDASISGGSILVQASARLNYVMASVCSEVAGVTGVINFASNAQPTSGGPPAVLFYPPLPFYTPKSVFSFSAALNGFNISMEPLSSIPPTAQSLVCVDNFGDGFSAGQIWYENGDNQTLSIIATPPFSQTLYRYIASAIVLGGTLKSSGNAVEFTPNGTTWPNVMSDNRWAQDITNLICNATWPLESSCSVINSGISLLDFSASVNYLDGNSTLAAWSIWSTALGMAMGAYSSASWPTPAGTSTLAFVTFPDTLIYQIRYGTYVLMVNTMASGIMLIVVVWLRSQCRLGPDFLNATRLLLNPLNDPELFNASLDATVNALADPYMLVSEDNEFVLVEASEMEKMRKLANGVAVSGGEELVERRSTSHCLSGPASSSC